MTHVPNHSGDKKTEGFRWYKSYPVLLLSSSFLLQYITPSYYQNGRAIRPWYRVLLLLQKPFHQVLWSSVTPSFVQTKECLSPPMGCRRLPVFPNRQLNQSSSVHQYDRGEFPLKIPQDHTMVLLRRVARYEDVYIKPPTSTFYFSSNPLILHCGNKRPSFYYHVLRVWILSIKMTRGSCHVLFLPSWSSKARPNQDMTAIKVL